MKCLLFVPLLFLLSIPLCAQEGQSFQFDHFIPSKAFGDERKITVYLPPSYYKSPDEQFTVTYILDGHYDPFIDLAVKTIEYNANTGRYTPTIVVGIHAKARGWEFTAPVEGDEDDENYEGGRAPQLQQHFKNEVFPLIDSLYKRTLPFRTIVGHSSGGGFVLYTLFSDQKDLFDGYVGISPAIRSDSEYILENAARRLADGEIFRKFLYCTSGTVGEREVLFGGAIQRLDSVLQQYPGHGLIWRKSTFEGMGHWTCVSPSVSGAMLELTRAFRVDEQMFYDFSDDESKNMTSSIEAFYKERNEHYGFSDIPATKYIHQAARWIAENDNQQAALEIYEWALRQYPEDYQLTKSKGKLLLQMDEQEAAIAAFNECLGILEKIRVKYEEEDYSFQKEYLQKKIREASE